MGYVSIDNNGKLQSLLQDIFPDEFMRKHTNFLSFEAFRYSSAVIVNWNANPMVYSEELLDCFVRESTRFHSWDEMVHFAAALRFPSIN